MWTSFTTGLSVSRSWGIGRLLLGCAMMALLPGWLAGQSVLERSPNLSGGWIAPRGVVQFDFVHRFNASPAPERKVTNFPSFIVAAGLPAHTMVGFFYTTNSTLAPRYPNEWEFFGQAAPLRQVDGRPVDVGVEAGYNLAAKGFVGELSLARRVGPVRLLAIGRLLADPGDGPLDGAVGGGAVLRLGRWIGVAGDVVTVTRRAAGERVAWSAGLQLGIPHTPHTLSLQASNASGIGLESASRGTGQTLYGLEFTIPITLRRYFGGGRRPRADSAPPKAAEPGPGLVVVHIKDLAYGTSSLKITVGTTVEWVNDDQVAHSVIATTGAFDSGLFESGTSWRHLFSEAGSYTYSCQPHPFMHGTVIVTASP
jgi:plastocyanin